MKHRTLQLWIKPSSVVYLFLFFKNNYDEVVRDSQRLLMTRCYKVLKEPPHLPLHIIKIWIYTRIAVNICRDHIKDCLLGHIKVCMKSKWTLFTFHITPKKMVLVFVHPVLSTAKSHLGHSGIDAHFCRSKIPGYVNDKHTVML